MGNNSELLDRTIDYLVTFPVTTIGILLKPATVLNAEYEDRRCPPGAVFALALTVWFIGNRTILRILSGGLDIPLVPAGDGIARIIISTSVLLLVQALVLSALFSKKHPFRDWRLLAQYLAYPVAIYFLFDGLVSLLSIYFPDVFRSLSIAIANLECRYDSGMGDCSEWIELTATDFYSQVNKVSHTFGAVFYLLVLHSVIRVYFGTGFPRSIGITLIALVVAIAVLLAGFLIADRTEQSIEDLSQIQRHSLGREESSQLNSSLPESD